VTRIESLSLLAAFSGVFVNVVAFGLLIWQLRILARQLGQARDATALDHDRRQKQATIDFYAVTLDKMAELRAVLPYDRDEAGVQDMLSRVKGEDDQVGKAITEYLSLFELLATGVRTGVFDLSVLERAAGGRIRAIASHYRPWIQQRRELFDNPHLYEELEQLASEIRHHRVLRLQRSTERTSASAT
jgi:hypothetical protein